MTFEEFLTDCYATYSSESNQRVGQYLVNKLRVVDLDLYCAMAQLSDVDPFYDDSLVPAFLVYISERWQNNA